MRRSGSNTLRKFGSKLVGPIPWGTHLCQFYETKQDLIDILVPYFAEGLRSNEFCMWVTSPPLEVEEAKEVLKESVPELDDYIKKGQIEIIAYDKWYLSGGKFDSKRVLQGWVDKEEAALEHGFEGLRLTGNTFWIERDLWNSFVDYEEAVNSVIGEYRMIAVCTYCLLSCSGTDVIDVVRNHVGTLIKQGKNWGLIENAARRKLANGALELSERKYSALFENMVDGFAYHKIILDGKGKPVDYVFLEVNNAFEKLTGLKRETILGKKATEVLPGIDKDPADWIGVYGKVALTGKPAHFENYAEPLGRWYLVSAFSPEIGYFAATFEDVTGRKKAEEAVIRQASLIDLSPDAIIVRSLEGTITFWSKGAENIYGWTATEAIGQITHALLKTRFPEPLKAIISQVETSGRWTGELGHKTKDGRDLVVQSWWLAEKDEKGTIKGILESNIDVTERKESEEKLRESTVWEATSFYTRNLIEVSPDPLVTISAEGKITDVNKATENVTGYSREELIGSDFLNYFTEPDKASAGYKQVFTEGFVKDYPLAIRHKSGRVTDVLYNASIYRNAEGEVEGVFAAARDVTERKILEKKLQDSERLATIGATAGMVGHDIRNPLQAITSDVYLAKTDLASTPESEEKKNVLESLQEIEKNVDYVNKIVADLQDFARPIAPKIEEVDLEQTIQSVLARVEIPGNVTVRHSNRKGFPKLKADSAYLQRILTNLTNNAIQAMPKGGKLVIHAVAANGKAVITVEDNGEGIPESVRSKLFMPLVTTKSRGQGFGLSVVKKFTEGMGGTVTFESKVGKGTKFIIELPI